MNVASYFHPEAFFVLPAISLEAAQCECCGQDCGWALCLGWAVWSVAIIFGESDCE